MAWYTVQIPQPVPQGVAQVRIKIKDNSNNTSWEHLVPPTTTSYPLWVIYGHNYTVYLSYLYTSGVESQPSSFSFTAVDNVPPLEPGNMTFTMLSNTCDNQRVNVLFGLPIIVQPGPDEYVCTRTLTVGNHVITVPCTEAAITVDLVPGTYSVTLQDADEAGNRSPIHTQTLVVTRPQPPRPGYIYASAVSQSGNTITYKAVTPINMPSDYGVASQQIGFYLVQNNLLNQISLNSYPYNNSNYPLVNCTIGNTYLLRLWYVSENGVESEPTDYMWTCQDTVPPATPGPIVCKIIGPDGPGYARVNISWKAPPSDVVKQHIVVSRLLNPEVTVYDSDLAPSVVGIDISLLCGENYRITLVWYDSANNASSCQIIFNVNCSVIPPAPPPVTVWPTPQVPAQPGGINPLDVTTWPTIPSIPTPPLPKGPTASNSYLSPTVPGGTHP